MLVARLKPGLLRLGEQLDGVMRPEPRAQLDRYAARLAGMDTPPDIAAMLVRIESLTGAVGVGLLSSELGTDEAAMASAYSVLGEATGLDWAKGAAFGLEPADPWERLLKAGLVQDFDRLRLGLLRKITPAGGDPQAAVAKWLAVNPAVVSRIATPMARARAGAVVTTAMLAHLASVARLVLG